MSYSLRPSGLHSPWSSTGHNTGVGSASLLQGIFSTQDRTQVARITGGFFTNWATREALSPLKQRTNWKAQSLQAETTRGELWGTEGQTLKWALDGARKAKFTPSLYPFQPTSTKSMDSTFSKAPEQRFWTFLCVMHSFVGLVKPTDPFSEGYLKQIIYLYWNSYQNHVVPGYL